MGRFSWKEATAWLILLVVAASLRFWQLDSRPPHHDEAIHGYFARELLHRRSYRYDPTYHGPFQYFVLAAIFAIFGESDRTLRSYSAFCGTVLVMVPLLLRRLIGRGPALGMGWLLALSPSFLYFSRFARNDVPVVLFTALALSLVWLQKRSQYRLLPWASLLLALHAVSKETVYVTGVLWLLAGAGLVVWTGCSQSIRWLNDFWRQRQRELAAAVAVFAVVCGLFYTVFFSWPQDLLFLVKAVAYWYGQHKIQRVGGPWTYYFPRLVLYEFLILGLALAAVVRRRHRLTVPERFTILWGLAALAMYAYLGEKVPWLVVHQVTPWVMLAGVEVASILQRPRGWLAKVLVAGGVLATLWSAVAVNYLYPTIEPQKPQAELLVFVQTTKTEQALADELPRLRVREAGDQPWAAVAGEALWPLSWQWGKERVRWSLPAPEAAPPLVVANPGELQGHKQVWGESYLCELIPLRAWWVESWQRVNLTDLGRWFFTRRAWSPRGSTDVEVCRRKKGA